MHGNMELKFFSPSENTSIAKVTVHRSGKMGFSKGAAELLQIDKKKYCKFGVNEENKLFIVMFERSDDSTFNIAKAGEYYYVTARSLLNDMGIDYKSKDTFIFDLVKTEQNNIYRMDKRVIKK